MKSEKLKCFIINVFDSVLNTLSRFKQNLYKFLSVSGTPNFTKPLLLVLPKLYLWSRPRLVSGTIEAKS